MAPFLAAGVVLVKFKKNLFWKLTNTTLSCCALSRLRFAPVCEGTGPFLDGADIPPPLRRGISLVQHASNMANLSDAG
jgi:hypothetical protein